MATVATFLTNVRWQLRDADASLYDDDSELLLYLNTAIAQLDSILSQINSDRVLTNSTLALGAAANYVAAPTGCMVGRHAWISTDFLHKVDPDYIMVRRKNLGTTTGQPMYWAHQGANIIFDYTTDDAYSVDFYYDVATTAITATSTSMPYSDVYNDMLLQGVTILAKSPREYSLNAEGVLHDFFMENAMKREIKRRHSPKKYIVGF